MTLSRDRVARALGPLWERLEGRCVLESGCGAGRFTEVLVSKGARVLSVDLSSAVDVNAENVPIGAHHRVAQADLLRLPFLRRQFDVVFCLGVLQHLPNPERGIAALYEQVAPGGTFVIDHYRASLGWYLRTAPIVRALLRRMSPSRAAVVVAGLVRALLPLHRAVRGHVCLRKLLNRVSPLVTYYDAFPGMSDELQREWALLDTFDSLTDHYKHFRTRDEIARTLRALGAIDLVVTQNELVVIARGRRPVLGDSP